MHNASIFIAAPNAVEHSAVIDGIVLPVLASMELQGVRMPNLGSPLIADEILANVRDCRAMIAIVIGRNPNVFWELGLAYALGKPIVLLADVAPEFGLLANAARCVLRGIDDEDTRLRLADALIAVNEA